MVDDDGDWNDGDDVADARIDDEGKRKTVKERQKKKKRERETERETERMKCSTGRWMNKSWDVENAPSNGHSLFISIQLPSNYWSSISLEFN